MTWRLSNEARVQGCGRHVDKVFSTVQVAIKNPRIAELEIENGRLREKVRALTGMIDCLADRLHAVEGLDG